MSQKKLIEECKKGNNQALKELYETYAPRMLGVCYRYAGNRELAEDMLHDGFMTVFAKIGSFRSEGSFDGWIRRVFVNTSLEHIRKNKKMREHQEITDRTVILEDSPSALEDLSAESIMSVVERLPDGFRVIFNMYAIDGYSHAEIAKELNINESTSRSQYSRARAILMQELQNER